MTDLPNEPNTGEEAIPRRPGEPAPGPNKAPKHDGGAARIIQGGEGGGADAGQTLDDPGRGGD